MTTTVFSAKQATASVIEDAKARGLTVVGTHSGTHHCDEVISCCLLKMLHPDCIIFRQRDLELLKLCDIVVDVGGEYNPSQKTFDHHQDTFSTVWDENRKIRLSSAGLVWKHYGEDVIRKIAPKRSSDDEIKTLHQVIYDLVFESIDAGDNGVKPCLCKPNDVEYIGAMPGLSGLVAACNTSWIVWENESDCFKKAMLVVERHFMPILHHLANNWFEAVEEIKTAETMPIPKHPEASVLLLKEYYLFGKFFRYVLQDRPEIVGVIWNPCANVWCSTFRPWKWLERSKKPFLEFADAATKEAVLDKLSQQFENYSN